MNFPRDSALSKSKQSRWIVSSPKRARTTVCLFFPSRSHRSMIFGADVSLPLDDSRFGAVPESPLGGPFLFLLMSALWLPKTPTLLTGKDLQCRPLVFFGRPDVSAGVLTSDDRGG